METKEKINESSLVVILGGIALFAFFQMFFSNLADKVDAYYSGHSVPINKALKQILKGLKNSKSLIGKIDDYVQEKGPGDALVYALMGWPEIKSELNKFKSDKEINLEELNIELTKLLQKAFQDEAEEQGLTYKFKKKIRNQKWSN